MSESYESHLSIPVSSPDVGAELRQLNERMARLEQMLVNKPLPPQPVWRDVTAECEVDRGAMEHQGNHVLVLTAFGAMNHYRLTKISGPLTPHVAFIVEKRT